MITKIKMQYDIKDKSLKELLSLNKNKIIVTIYNKK